MASQNLVAPDSELKATCSSSSFKALMSTQFLGALNDNVFKLLVSFLILNTLVQSGEGTMYLSFAQAAFLAPFILFSSYSGFLADRFPKSQVMVITKVMEVAIMLIGVVFLYFKNVPVLLVVLFLMGLQSTLFSPCKYGILPELLEERQLSKGNGYLGFYTFLAIIFGTVLASFLAELFQNNYAASGAITVLVAALGLSTSFKISKTVVANPQAQFILNPFRDVFSALRSIRQDRALFLTLYATAYFWFIGALCQLNVLLYAKQTLEVAELATGVLVTSLGLGIGIGSILAGKVSEGRVELGLVPIGAVGIGISSSLLYFSQSSYFFSLLCLLVLGLSAGMFIVPLTAFFQKQSPVQSRGRYIAASNVINFSGMLIASLMLWVFTDLLSFTPAGIFFISGLLTFGAAFIIIRVLPEVLIRCINWTLTHTFYRIRVVGLENIPEKGGALIVINHVSFVDASLILAALERPVRFLMYRPIYEHPLIHPIAKAMKTIPVEGGKSRKEISSSLELAREAIQNGELVCIFAEGAISRIGQLLPFKKGFERIMEGVPAPIIPAHLDSVWGSIFSFRGKKFFAKLPKELPYRVTLSFGAPLPASAQVSQVRSAVQELSSRAFPFRQIEHQVLHEGFLKTAKRYLFRPCIADSGGLKLNYLQTLVASLCLAGEIRKLAPSEKIGILLPPSVGGVLANLGVQFAGHIPVNLNYTASSESMHSAIQRCEITTIISSPKFLEKLKLQNLPPTQDIQSLLKATSRGTKLKHLLAVLLFSRRILLRLYAMTRTSRDSLATIIFSSGSTGEPKGVMLSHGNISSNIASLYEVFEMKSRDGVLGILPFFHSFGFTGTLWLPILTGARAVYHYNPLDASTIGKLVRKNKLTLLIATPTFLSTYIKKCKKDDFETLERVAVGAEKLKVSLSESFEQKFGITPMEGYGATELSPVAIINVPDFIGSSGRQTGYKLGSVGHPIPGVAVKIVHPETFETLPPDTDGLMLVTGPNVMLGYLNNPELTNEVIRDGWYITGDIARLDKDGFVTIADRLSRFSKIGGEMVPHILIEEKIHELLGSFEQLCAVTAVSDDRRGERLVVLYKEGLDMQNISAELSSKDLPNLWIPKPDSFFPVPELPILGSGKLDLKKIKLLAEEFTSV